MFISLFMVFVYIKYAHLTWTTHAATTGLSKSTGSDGDSQRQIQLFTIMFAKVHHHEPDHAPVSGAAFKQIGVDFFQHCGRVFKNNFKNIALTVIPDP